MRNRNWSQGGYSTGCTASRAQTKPDARRGRKVLSLLLSVCLVLGLSPAVSFAATPDADISWYLADTDASSYTLTDASDLEGLAALVNGTAVDSSGNAIEAQTFEGVTIYLPANGRIDYYGNTLTPIGGQNGTEFNGTFDGQGATIDNFTIDTTNSENLGVFGQTGEDSVIRNVTIGTAASLSITRSASSSDFIINVGMLVGYSKGDVENCTNNGTLTVESAVAPGIILASWAEADEDGNYDDDDYTVDEPIKRIGGLAGTVEGDVTNCTNNGSVTVTSNASPEADYSNRIVVDIGGVVGYQGSVEARGTLASTDQHGTISNCVNTGDVYVWTPNVSGEDRFGNTSYAQSSEVGGIAGYARGSILNSENSGYIRTDHGTQVGGIVGSFRSIQASQNQNANYVSADSDDGSEDDPIQVYGCYNTGTIYGASACGGIAGQMGTYTTVTSCINDNDYVIGNNDTKPAPGGIVGRSYGTVSYCANFGTVASAVWANEEERTLTLKGGYYTAGLVGMLLYYYDSETGERNSPQPEVYGCYNAGAVQAISGMRQRALVGNNEGYVHDNLSIENPGTATDLVYGDDPSESEASGSAANNSFMSSSELKSSAAVAALNAYADADGWDVYWSYSDGSVNNGYPVLNRQITWDATDISSATVSLVANATYTGGASIPTATVTLADGTELVQNADFRVIPDSDENVEITDEGETPYTATIVGVGAYSGEASAKLYYGMDQGDLDLCTVLITSATFNWEEQTPSEADVTLTNSLGGAVDSSEYSFYLTETAIDAGSYEVIITANEDSTHFYGTTTGTFRITAASLTSDSTVIENITYLGEEYPWISNTSGASDDELPVFAYTGYPIKPGITSVTYLGVELELGTDYRLVYGNLFTDDTSSTDSIDSNNIGEEGGTARGSITVREVTGGNFTNYTNMVFFITDYGELLDISAAEVTCDDVPYDGIAQTPVVVNYGGSDLVEGTDYVITYTNNVSVGTASYTITGIGRFTGTITGTFEILDEDPYTFTYESYGDGIAITGVIYTGSRDTFDMVIPETIDGQTVVAIADGAFGGSSRTAFTDSEANLSKLMIQTVTIPATVTEIGEYAFGTAASTVTPSITEVIFEGDSQLRVIGTGAFERCQNLTSFTFPAYVEEIGDRAFRNASNITVLIFLTSSATLPSTVSSTAFYGMGALGQTVGVYCDSSASAVLAIIDGNSNTSGYGTNGGRNFVLIDNFLGNLANAQVADIPDQTYTGSAITPALTVTINGTTLVEGSDYTVSFTYNTNAGTAYYTITGVASAGYIGSKQGSFTIAPYDVTGLASIADIPDQGYTGSAIRPDLTVTVGDTTLTAGTDYTVTYENNIESGIATVTVVARGNYTGTIGTASFNIVNGMNVFAGTSRLDTSARVVKEALAQSSSGSYEGVIIATSERPYDSLSASGLSGLLGYPILLTSINELASETAEVLQELRDANGVGLNIIILGDENSVSEDVETALKAYGTTTRIDGADRYETSLKIYEYGAQLAGGWDAEYAIVATGENYPDALSIASYAASYAAPVFLVNGSGSSEFSSTMATYLSRYSNAVVLGDTNAVNADLYEELEDLVSGTVERLSGDSRYTTCIAIVDWELSQGMTISNMGFATGENFPDALASGFLLGCAGGTSEAGSVLMLVSNKSDNADVLAYLRSLDTSGVHTVNVFGDDNAVSATVKSSIASALSWTQWAQTMM